MTGEFDGFYEEFDDWAQNSAAFYKRASATINSSTGILAAEADTLLGTVNVGIWVNRSQETNVNDKFIDQKVGQMTVNKSDLTFTIDLSSYALIGGKKYYIEGTDDIGFQGEILLLTWRREQ